MLTGTFAFSGRVRGENVIITRINQISEAQNLLDYHHLISYLPDTNLTFKRHSKII